MTVKNLSIIFFVLFSTISIFAQNEFKDGAFKHLGIGFSVSTMGFGVEANTRLSTHFKLRTGFNFVTVTHTENIRIRHSLLNQLMGYDPRYRMRGRLNLTNAHVLFDIHPLQFGIFHFTTGVYIGESRFRTRGYLVNPLNGERIRLPDGHTWDEIRLVLDEHDIVVNEGQINASLSFGNVIKPYLGFGIGRSLPKSRFGFMFEAGAIYQGNFSINQDGRKNIIVERAKSSFSDDIDRFAHYLRFWPVVSLQVTYRVF